MMLVMQKSTHISRILHGNQQSGSNETVRKKKRSQWHIISFTSKLLNLEEKHRQENVIIIKSTSKCKRKSVYSK